MSKMKNIYLFILLLAPFFVHSQNWEWAKQEGGNGVQDYDNGYLVTDGTNNYLFGLFSGIMVLKTDTLFANGCTDFYVIKYDSNGTEIWARSFGGYNGTDPSETMGCAYDSVNNCIYISAFIQMI